MLRREFSGDSENLNPGPSVCCSLCSNLKKAPARSFTGINAGRLGKCCMYRRVVARVSHSRRNHIRCVASENSSQAALMTAHLGLKARL